MVKKINLEEKNMDSHMNITSLNTQAMKKTFRKKVSLTNKLIIAGLVVTTTIGAVAGGVYVYQQNQKFQQEKLENEKQIFNNVDKMIHDEPKTAELIELKEQYGDLYYLVEPMTEEQINEGIKTIFDYNAITIELAKNNQKNDEKYDEFGFYYADVNEYMKVANILGDKLYSTFSNIFESEDKSIAKWKPYYDPSGYHFNSMMILPYLTIENGLEKMPMELKEAYVRYWKTQSHIVSSVRQEQGLSPNPFYADESPTSSVDFDKQIVYIKR